MLCLHALRERFLPDFRVLHFDTRRIFLPDFLPERLRRRRRRDFLLELRLTRRIFLPLRERRPRDRLLETRDLILRQYPTREPFLPLTHVAPAALSHADLPSMLAALTRRIFLPLERRRFDDLRVFFE